MSKFRFAVMGAANIANKFCDAVAHIEDCEVVAVSSRSMDRAKEFAKKNRISAAYDNYEKMLVSEKPDAVYIAVTTNAHYDLCMLCLKYHTPFLCEKTMCIGSEQTREVFLEAKKCGVFCMEAMWSRFLPAINKVQAWCREGRIGKLRFGDISIGFQSPVDPDNRFYSKALGGGAALDLTVYCYEIMTYLMEKPILEAKGMSNFAKTGVDISNVIILRYEDAMACLKGSIAAHYEEKMVLFGENGHIVVPSPHFASQAYLYDKEGREIAHFVDNETKNGFIYEILEVMECVRAGKTESSVVPHELTLAYARLCDELFLHPDEK